MKELEQLILSKSRPVQKEVKQLQKSELDRLIIEAFLGEQQQTLPGFEPTKQEKDKKKKAEKQKKEQNILNNYDTARKDGAINPETIYITGDPNKAPGIPSGFIKGASKNEKGEYFLVEGLISAGLGLPEPSKVSGPLPADKDFII